MDYFRSRRRPAFWLCVPMLLILAGSPAAAAPVSLTVDGRQLTVDAAPVVRGSRAFVPMRAIFEALGAGVSWDPRSRKITASRGETVFIMHVGSVAATVSGRSIQLDAPPLSLDGRVLVPARFIAEQLGAQVHWDAGRRLITVRSGAVPAPKSLLAQQKSTLRNPSWSELKEFLKADDTDTMPYIAGVFDCTGFAITLRDNAWRHGIRSAYVEVECVSGGAGHALNAFETTDWGLVYVDNTTGDYIAYIKLNQPYGIIHLSGVKFEYIAVSGSPAAFWGPLTYRTHPNPFSYDYYLEYRRRVRFYEESLQAYSDAVAEFNRGDTRWSYAQLSAWYDNLEVLEQDLGLIVGQHEIVVANIQAHWN